MLRCILLIVVAILVSRGDANSVGAPVESCLDLRPAHGDPPYAPQLTAPPYKITWAPDGDNYLVSLEQTDVFAFEGFLLQARLGRTGQPLGVFSNLAVDTHHLECSAPEDSVTQDTSAMKSGVAMTWTPPIGSIEGVSFIATVCHNLSMHWSDVMSEPFPPSSLILD